jgi:tetratricopeptide (TPR) repeat protein
MTVDQFKGPAIKRFREFADTEEYRPLLRAIRRQQGFGLIFVRCSPDRGRRLMQELERDLPRKHCETLSLKESVPVGDFFTLAQDWLQAHPAEVLFVEGLEHSLLAYEESKRQSGWKPAEQWGYSWKDVPPILRNLNQQRDRFRNEFQTCFVFFLPLFAIRYMIRRAPDFFDWRSGVFEFKDEMLAISQKISTLTTQETSKLSSIPLPERIYQALEIKDLLDDPSIPSNRRFQLFCHLSALQKVNGDTQSALKSFEKACKIDVTEAGALALKGQTLILLGRFEEALLTLDASIALNPDDAGDWHNRGVALGNLGRHAEALSSYDKAIELHPDHAGDWHNRGVALGNLGRDEEALSSFDKALELHPDDADAWHNRGVVLGNLGRYEEALSSFDKAIVLNPDDAVTWHNRGVVLGSLGRYEEALSSFDKAIELNPDDADTWRYRGLALGQLGRLEEALSSFDKAIELNPDQCGKAPETLRSSSSRSTSTEQGGQAEVEAVLVAVDGPVFGELAAHVAHVAAAVALAVGVEGFLVEALQMARRRGSCCGSGG